MHDSWALTLYTLWQLQQLHRHDAFERAMETHNSATLMSFSVHAPQELPKLTDRYLDQFVPPITDSERHWQRYRALVNAHRQMIPTEPH